MVDEYGGSIDETTTITFKAPSYTTIESSGDVTLLKDDDSLGYAQDGQGNNQAISYRDGEQIRSQMWTGWEYLAAEKVNGSNLNNSIDSSKHSNS